MKSRITPLLIALIIASSTIPSQTVHAAIACPLTAQNGEIVVNFSATSLFSSTTPNRITQSASVPAGMYNLTAITWDAHTSTGEANQTSEQVRFIFKDSTGEIVTTNATNDIATNQDTTTSTLGSITVGRNSTSITAEHAVIGATGLQSVTPICIKLAPINNSTTLGVTCSVSDTTVETKENVTFSALVQGGMAPFSYDWDLDVDGSSAAVTKKFSQSGTYRARITVTDNAGRVAQKNCDSVRASDNNDNNDDFEVSCRVSDTTIDKGDTVTYSVRINNGNSPYDIEWDGDISGDDESERVRFNKNGRYEAEVTVRDDDGNRDSDTCPIVRVGDTNDDDNTVNIISSTTQGNGTTRGTPTGALAGLDAVFLSQVPYTGPEDIAKAAGVIALLAIWSAGIAMYLQTQRTKTRTTKHINNFKAMNRTMSVIK